jgi:ribosomal-protein-alanine acetyltransferase
MEGCKTGMSAGPETSALFVRGMAPQDLPHVVAIASRCPEAAQWSLKSYEELHQHGQLAWVAEANGSVAGFLVACAIAQEVEILNLAVDPTKRRRGYALALLNHALAELQRSGVQDASLEVRESNQPAIQFYLSQGFVKSGRRTGYYRHPDEAAVCMSKKITA